MGDNRPGLLPGVADRHGGQVKSEQVESQAEYSDRLRALEQRFAEMTRQQDATVEVLRVIGESAQDLGRVFDTVLRNAVTLLSRGGWADVAFRR